MEKVITVQVWFKETTIHGEYTDAVYIPYADYLTKSDKQVNDIAVARVDEWVKKISEEKALEAAKEFPQTEV